MWCMPSRNRPEKCRAMLSDMVARGMTAEGVIGIDDDDPQIEAYRALPLPPGWTVMEVHNEHGGAGESWRQAYARFPGKPWYGVVADDMSIETDGFESALVQAAGAWGIASSNDDWQSNADVMKGRMHGVAVFGGEFLRALGYWAPPGFRHLYLDDLWESLGRTLGNWRTLMDVVTPHHHPWKTGEAMDATTAAANSSENNEHDRQVYERWRTTQAEVDVLRVLRAREPNKVFRIVPQPKPIEPGLWLYLWNGDDRHLHRFFRALQEQGCVTRGAIVVPRGVAVPDSKWIPTNWFRELPMTMGEPEWIGLLWSDSAPQRPGWDQSMLQDIRPWCVVTSAEAVRGDWRQAAVMLGTGVIKAIGGIDPHDITDKKIALWQTAVRKVRCEYIRNDSQVPRESKSPPLPHAGKGAAEVSTALRAMLEEYDVRIIDPDYAGVRLRIATPSISGRPEFVYNQSIRLTENMLREKGAYCEHAFDLYNADIGLSRAKIVAEFAESNCTHLLMIDDDMGWDVSAVHTMFNAKKDFVAVAGPKKSYPLRFACSHLDENNQPLPLQKNRLDGTAEVSLVGGAFMLLTKAMVTRMIDEYPELGYDGADSKPAWALFDSFVRNRFRYSEDFAFCRRWLDIGGKIYVCPDVRLKHHGGHTYEGSITEHAGRTL